MSGSWDPPGSSGQGPPAGENTEPSLLRGVTPGDNEPEGGFRTNLQNLRESISVVGQLSSAMSAFYTKVGGEGKRKVTEFHTVIKALNADLESTKKQIKEIAEASGKVGGGGQDAGGLFTPGPGGSYIQRQLPKPPPTAPTAPEPEATGGGRWAVVGRAALGIGAVGATVGRVGGSYMARQMPAVEATDMYQRRMAERGIGMGAAGAMMNRALSPGGGFASREEFIGTSQTLEQRGLSLGGASYDWAMQGAGRLANAMPQFTPGEFAGAAATLRHGEAGRNLRMKGIIDWNMPMEQVFEQILKAGTRNKQMPTLDMIRNANPGSPYYEVLMVLTGGDPELVRMALEYGASQAAGGAAGGTAGGVTGARRGREAASERVQMERQEELAGATVALHDRMRSFSESIRTADDKMEGLIAGISGAAATLSRVGDATGGIANQAMSVGSMWAAGRWGAGKNLIPDWLNPKNWGRGGGGGGGGGSAAGTGARGMAGKALGKVAAPLMLWEGWNAAKGLGESSVDIWHSTPWGGSDQDWDWRPDEGEPSGGPPVGYIPGADHTGEGYSKRGFGGVKPHVAQAGHYVTKMFGTPPGGIGGVGQRANKSDHPKGLALDFMTNKNYALGDKIANFMVRNAKHFGVKYVIWKQRINSIDGRGWRGMEDRGSPTANHFDHPHVSFHDAPGTGGSVVTDADFAEEMPSQAGGFAGSLTSAATRGSSSGGFTTEEADFLQSFFGSTGSPGARGTPTREAGSQFSGEGSQGGGGNFARGASLEDQELMSVLRGAGFRGQSLITAFAIAKAESGGNAGAHNPNAATGDNSYGLFQINMLGDLGPSRRKQYGLSSNTDLFDPHTNARIAYDISGGGTNWSAWSVHPSSKSRGAKGSGYEKHLDTARSVASAEPRGGLEDIGSLGAVGEGAPPGGIGGGAIGGLPSVRGGQTRQVNFNVKVSFERATRKEARELFEMMKEMASKEEGIKMVGSR